MRQGFFAVAAFAAGLLALSPAQAANKSAAYVAPHIAVVDLQQVLANSHRGKEANTTLQQKQSELQSQANDLNDKRKAYKDQLDKADAKSADYPKLLKQYQDADAAFQAFVQDGRQLLQQRQQELVQPIQQELITVLNQYAKANHIDILLAKGNAALTANDSYDVTSGVTAALDKDWAALQQAAPASTPAPSASTGGSSH